MRKIILSAAAALAICGAGVALAQPGPMGFGGGWGHHEGLEILHKLELTEAQQAQVKSIMKDGFQADRPLMDQIHGLREQMASRILAPGQVSADQFGTEMGQIAQIEQQLAQNRLAIVLKVRALLTPEQLTKAADLHTKLAALHAQARQVMGEPD